MKSKYRKQGEDAVEKVGFLIQYEAACPLEGSTADCAPSNYTVPMKGRVFGIVKRLDNARIPLGQVEFTLIRAGNAWRNQVSLEKVLRFNSLESVWSLFQSNSLKPSIASAFPMADPGGDILLITRMDLAPIARGKRLGLSIVSQLIRDFGAGCGLAILEPFPLETAATRLLTPEQIEAVSQKLRNYYRVLGFEPISETDFVAVAINDPRLFAVELPSTIELPLTTLIDAWTESQEAIYNSEQKRRAEYNEALKTSLGRSWGTWPRPATLNGA